MELTIKVTGNTAAEMRQSWNEQIETVQTLWADWAKTQVEEKTQTPTKKTKAAPVVEEEETFGEDETTEDAEPTHTIEEVRAALAAFVKRAIKKGDKPEAARAKVQEILKKNFKVTRTDELTKAQYAKTISLVS
ncbi:MAG TPA: hypothetical protein VIJ46_02970 [Rhabdochlamydiaceae bacterium]